MRETAERGEKGEAENRIYDAAVRISGSYTCVYISARKHLPCSSNYYARRRRRAPRRGWRIYSKNIKGNSMKIPRSPRRAHSLARPLFHILRVDRLNIECVNVCLFARREQRRAKENGGRGRARVHATAFVRAGRFRSSTSRASEYAFRAGFRVCRLSRM